MGDFTLLGEAGCDEEQPKKFEFKENFLVTNIDDEYLKEKHEENDGFSIISNEAVFDDDSVEEMSILKDQNKLLNDEIIRLENILKKHGINF